MIVLIQCRAYHATFTATLVTFADKGFAACPLRMFTKQKTKAQLQFHFIKSRCTFVRTNFVARLLFDKIILACAYCLPTERT